MIRLAMASPRPVPRSLVEKCGRNSLSLLPLRVYLVRLRTQVKNQIRATLTRHNVQVAGSHVVRLHQRIKRAKNHQKAVVAVARHLAEGLPTGFLRNKKFIENRA